MHLNNAMTKPVKTEERLPKREHYSEVEAEVEVEDTNLESQLGKSQIDGRQTDPALPFEREQQPVVNHQDRRQK